MTDPAAPVTLTDAMAHAGRDALRQAADLFGATLPEDWRETQAMAVVVYEAMIRAAAPEPPATLHLRIEKADDLPAFAAFAHHPDQGDERLVLLNVFATFAAARDNGIPTNEILVGSLMHEFGHILEAWLGLEFDEARIEAICQSYALATEGEAPKPPADDLAALIAECEARDWEWRLERVCVQDGPDSCVLTRIAAVKPIAWQGARFDETDEDGWLGLSDDDAAGSLADLLRETMRAANAHTSPHARVNMDAARQAAGAGDGAKG